MRYTENQGFPYRLPSTGSCLSTSQIRREPGSPLLGGGGGRLRPAKARTFGSEGHHGAILVAAAEAPANLVRLLLGQPPAEEMIAGLAATEAAVIDIGLDAGQHLGVAVPDLGPPPMGEIGAGVRREVDRVVGGGRRQGLEGGRRGVWLAVCGRLIVGRRLAV